MPSVQTHRSQLTVRYGGTQSEFLAGPQGIQLQLPLPLLYGGVEELLMPAVVEFGNEAGLCWCRGADGSMVGVVWQPLSSVATMESDCQAAYDRFLSKVPGAELYRVWNYLPEINSSTDGLENYHRFNRGRWAAYLRHFRGQPQGHIPAASAVGLSQGCPMVSIFLAGEKWPQHLENPLQVPAWQYPSQYGPQSPSFSRATCVPWGGKEVVTFVSGTASIRGHATVAVADLEHQCQVTLENLDYILQQAGKPSLRNLAESSGFTAKIYLRHADQVTRLISTFRAISAEYLLERACVVQADICRACLDVEIEVTV